ncbi:MAG: choice-of-anchor D domain-containing protein [Terriglobia bacterium]
MPAQRSRAPHRHWELLASTPTVRKRGFRSKAWRRARGNHRALLRCDTLACLATKSSFLLTALAALGIISALTGCGGGTASVNSPASATNGQVSRVTVVPVSLSFGAVTMGSSSTLPVVVTNTGGASITISQATTAGAGFSITGPALPLTLAAGGDASFTVTFDPTAAGSAAGDLSIVSNAANSPTTTSFSATGVNKHSVTLTWASSTSPGVTSYNAYRGTTSGGPYAKLNSSPIASTTYTDSAVEAGQTYYYVTTAVNSQGVESADSNQATVVVPFP